MVMRLSQRYKNSVIYNVHVTITSKLNNYFYLPFCLINRFLLRENFGSKDLFLEATAKLILDGGTLSVDDTVLDKPYSHYMALVGHYYSGKHHKAVKGINLITLYYTDIKGYSLPVNFRIYNPADGKTKNDYFIDMLKEVLAWGLRPACVTGDSWYRCLHTYWAIEEYHRALKQLCNMDRSNNYQALTTIRVMPD